MTTPPSENWRDKPDEELTSDDITAMASEGEPVEVACPSCAGATGPSIIRCGLCGRAFTP